MLHFLHFQLKPIDRQLFCVIILFYFQHLHLKAIKSSRHLDKMLLIRLILPLVLIVFTSCYANIQEDSEESIESLDRAVESFNKIFSTVIPRGELKKFIELDRFVNDCSSGGGQLIGEIKTHLLNGLDVHSMSTHTVFEWCGAATHLLQLYAQQFEMNDQKCDNSQKQILLTVLNKKIEEMNEAQQELDDISEAFSVTIGKLSQLIDDFDEYSKFYGQQITWANTTCAAAYDNVIGPFGITANNCNPSGIVSSLFIPESTTKMDSVKSSFVDYLQTIQEANADIKTKKNQLQTEIQTISELKAEIEMTQTTLSSEYEAARHEITNSITQLIAHCDEFRRMRGLKE